jgi:hypothetical protein
MKQGVNLISREAQKTLRLLKVRQSLKMAIFGVVGIFVVFALLVFLVFFFLSQTLKSNQDKISALKEGIKALEKNESYAVIIANRVKGISSLLKERKSYLETMDEIGSLSVPGFTLENLEIDDKGGLKITGNCDSREALAAFDEKVEEIRGRESYSQINYPLVGRSVKGGYNVSLELKNE